MGSIHLKALAIILAALAMSGCTQQQNNSGGAGSNISIQDFSFSPAEITVKIGTTIIWANSGNATHTVTSDSGSELQSGTLSNGQAYSHKFTSTGTYAYHCRIHSSMKGTVTVQ